MTRYKILKELLDGRRVKVSDVCTILGLTLGEAYNLFSCDVPWGVITADDTLYIKSL